MKQSAINCKHILASEYEPSVKEQILNCMVCARKNGIELINIDDFDSKTNI